MSRSTRAVTLALGALSVVTWAWFAHAAPASLGGTVRVASVAAKAGSTPVAGWQIQSTAKVTGAGAAISTPGYAATGWFPVSARSTVLAGLIQNNRYPDLFVGTNLRDAVNPADFQVPWWYRTDVTIAAGAGLSTFLDVSGLIPRGDLWVNGSHVATSTLLAGAWTAHTFDITGLVRPGANSMAIEVYPNDPNRDLTLGWIDWNPAPPDHDMGIFRDVTIRRSGPVTLSSAHVLTAVAAGLGSAGVTVKADVQNDTAGAVSALVSGTIGAVAFQQTVQLQAHQTSTVVFTPSAFPQLTFNQPNLWWPVGMGAQPLYDLDLTATVAGAVSDAAQTRFGIRDVRSSLTSDGYRRYQVNGRPLLIRGGGWAPDLFLRYDRTRLEDQIRYTRDLGLNTIRLEGKLETDEFFQLADQYGILVLPGWECCDKWQSWGSWSAQDQQVATLSAASEAQQLRNHPSVIGFLIGSDMAPPGAIASSMVNAFRQNDWPDPIISSAADASTAAAGPSGMKMTGPYEWVPPVYWYTKREGGAFGFNSETSAGPDIPTLDTVKAALSPGDQSALWQSSSASQYHLSPAGSGPFTNLAIFDGALSSRYGAATSLSDYVTKAQLANYEVTRAQFEAYGRNFDDASQPSTGVVYWMLNNAWPSLHWHLFDSYLAQGGAYFGAKKANEPLHVQYSYDDASVVVVNQQPNGASGLSARATVYNTDGTQKFTRTAAGLAVAGGGGTTSAFRIPAIAGVSTAYFIELTLVDAGGRTVDRNVYWYSTRPDAVDYNGNGNTNWYYEPQSQFAALGSLTTLGTAPLDVQATSVAVAGGLVTTTVTLRNPATAGPPAFFTTLEVRGGTAPALPVTWSDNDVTLFAGQSATLTATYRASSLGGAPSVDVSGVNVAMRHVPAPFAGPSPSPAPSPTAPPSPTPSPTGTPTPGPTASPGPSPQPAASYEAESPANTLSGGARTGACAACSGGQDVRFVGHGGTLQFNQVMAGSGGTHTLSIAYLDGDAGRTADVSVNGGPPIAVAFAGTGSWSSVRTRTLAVQLDAGVNTITFANPTAWAPDLDRIEIS